MIHKITYIAFAFALIAINVLELNDAPHMSTLNNSMARLETLDNGSKETHHIGTANDQIRVTSSNIDDDGDTARLCTISARQLGWYENDGETSPSFSYHTIDSSIINSDIYAQTTTKHLKLSPFIMQIRTRTTPWI